jgi:hypothetical protein
MNPLVPAFGDVILILGFLVPVAGVITVAALWIRFRRRRREEQR